MENPDSQTNSSPTAQANESKNSKKGLWVAILAVILLAGIAYLLINRSSNEDNAANNSSSTNTNVSNEKPAVQENAKVSVTKSGFVPATIEIKAGTQVTWTNTDSAQHQVAADLHPNHSSIIGFNSNNILSAKDSYSFTFDKAGTYHYHDEMHPSDLKGTVIVK